MDDGKLRFLCSGCGKRLKVKPELAGKRIRCDCGQTATVPSPEVSVPSMPPAQKTPRVPPNIKPGVGGLTPPTVPSLSPELVKFRRLASVLGGILLVISAAFISLGAFALNHGKEEAFAVMVLVAVPLQIIGAGLMRHRPWAVYAAPIFLFVAGMAHAAIAFLSRGVPGFVYFGVTIWFLLYAVSQGTLMRWQAFRRQSPEWKVSPCRPLWMPLTCFGITQAALIAVYFQGYVSWTDVSRPTEVERQIHRASLSVDARIVAIQSEVWLRVLDTTTARELFSKNIGHNVRAIAVSPKGDRVAAAWDEVVTVWNIADGRQICSLSTLSLALAFSPDGATLVAGTSLWDVATGKERVNLRGPDAKEDQYVAARGMDFGIFGFSSDGRRIGASGVGGSVRFWDWRDGTATDAGSLKDCSDVKVIAFSPNDARIAIGEGSGAMAIYRLPRYTRQTAGMYPGAVQAVAFSPDGTMVVGGNSHGSVRIWSATAEDGLDPDRERDCIVKHGPPILAVKIPTDGKVVAVHQFGVQVWQRSWNMTAAFTTLVALLATAYGILFMLRRLPG